MNVKKAAVIWATQPSRLAELDLVGLKRAEDTKGCQYASTLGEDLRRKILLRLAP